MLKYQSEFVRIPFKILKKTMTENEVSKLDELINQRASEGWKLITYGAMMSDDLLSYTILITFGRESEEM